MNFYRDAIAAEEKAEFDRENRIPEEIVIKPEVEDLPKNRRLKITRRKAPYRTRQAIEENEFEVCFAKKRNWSLFRLNGKASHKFNGGLFLSSSIFLVYLRT